MMHYFPSSFLNEILNQCDEVSTQLRKHFTFHAFTLPTSHALMKIKKLQVIDCMSQRGSGSEGCSMDKMP